MPLHAVAWLVSHHSTSVQHASSPSSLQCPSGGGGGGRYGGGGGGGYGGGGGGYG